MKTLSFASFTIAYGVDVASCLIADKADHISCQGVTTMLLDRRASRTEHNLAEDGFIR